MGRLFGAFSSQYPDEITDLHEHNLRARISHATAFSDHHTSHRTKVHPLSLGFLQPCAGFQPAAVILSLNRYRQFVECLHVRHIPTVLAPYSGILSTNLDTCSRR